MNTLRSQNRSSQTLSIPIDELDMLEGIESNIFQAKVYASIEKEGMIEPLTIACITNDEWGESCSGCKPPPTEYQHVYLRIQRGNNRYRAAKEMGYTHIDCNLYLNVAEAIEAGNTQRKRSKRWRSI